MWTIYCTQHPPITVVQKCYIEVMIPPFLSFHDVMVAMIAPIQQQIQLLYFMRGKRKLFF